MINDINDNMQYKHKTAKINCIYHKWQFENYSESVIIGKEELDNLVLFLIGTFSFLCLIFWDVRLVAAFHHALSMKY